MSKKIGIADNTQARIISGAKVLFDTRITEEVNDTRDPANRISSERAWRNVLRIERLQDAKRK